MPRLLPGTSPETDLYALTDDELSLGRPAVEVAKALLDSGIKILQYREKEKKAGQMLKECLELRRLTREAGACFIVNDHVDIAVLCEADGVHVGQEDLPVEAVRRLVGADMIIGLSTHTPDQARAAVASGADYIGVGPIYPTQTKKDVCAAVTLDILIGSLPTSPCLSSPSEASSATTLRTSSRTAPAVAPSFPNSSALPTFPPALPKSEAQ